LIRPLKKIRAGYYLTSDAQFALLKVHGQYWNARERGSDDYLFFYSFPSLKSLIFAMNEYEL
jgi:hypothetical protein